ncbi:hypothetical protein [Aquimarina sp. 2201CG5-10]|nr:hypothetical protein [Aquimarina sp. 2201CG5-10]MDY8135403.1 hypothetical protein [Aquimarina sp. 2201CG5-10]
MLIFLISCSYGENGRIKIDSGIANNNNGALDDTEIQSTRFIYNGINK